MSQVFRFAPLSKEAVKTTGERCRRVWLGQTARRHPSGGAAAALRNVGLTTSPECQNDLSLIVRRELTNSYVQDRFAQHFRKSVRLCPIGRRETATKAGWSTPRKAVWSSCNAIHFQPAGWSTPESKLCGLWCNAMHFPALGASHSFFRTAAREPGNAYPLPNERGRSPDRRMALNNSRCRFLRLLSRDGVGRRQGILFLVGQRQRQRAEVAVRSRRRAALCPAGR